MTGPSRGLRLGLRRGRNRFENNYTGNRPAVFLLLGRIHPVSCGVDGKAVNHLLHQEILNLSIVVRVICLNDRDEATGTGGIESPQTWVEFHNVGPCRQRELRNRLVSVQSKDSE